MFDEFVYASPLGASGRFADRLFLERYLTGFLEQRARVLKRRAETIP